MRRRWWWYNDKNLYTRTRTYYYAYTIRFTEIPERRFSAVYRRRVKIILLSLFLLLLLLPLFVGENG